MNSDKKVVTIAGYIAGFPENVQALLKDMRQIIHAAAPQATETIRYDMPTFQLNGKNLVYFAAFKKHIGFYPAPRSVDAFKARLSAFNGTKGGVQFPLDKPIPADLVTDITKYWVEQRSKIET